MSGIFNRLFSRGKTSSEPQSGHHHHHHHGDKEDGELDWQKVWATEFAQPEVQASCLEYWQKHRYLDEVIARSGLNEESRVLDVGCGISSVLHFLPGERYGIDPLADEYKKLYRYPDELTINASAGEGIPYPDEHFDFVVNSNVLDHVTDPEQTLEEISRVLKPDGHFLLTVELFPDDAEKRDDPHHPHTLTREVLLEMVEKRFSIEYRNESPWIGLRGYWRGFREGYNTELILLLRKLQ